MMEIPIMKGVYLSKFTNSNNTNLFTKLGEKKHNLGKWEEFYPAK